MTEPSPVYQVTWSAEHEEDYQRRLLAAYRLVYRAHSTEPLVIPLRRQSAELLSALRECMSDRTRLLASQWERSFWKKERTR